MLDHIPSAVLSLRRSAWKPLVRMADGSITDSKFSGTPYLKADEEHPKCRNCGKPLQLFVQLNLDRLPAAVMNEYGSGLLQLFYCIGEDPLCEVECEAFFPFSESVLVRIVESESEVSNVGSAPENSFPPKLITGWEEIVDYPGWEEAETLGVEFEEGDWDQLFESGFPQGGDKLAGYPMWVQSIEYPDCPVCGEQMRLVFQIDSEDNLPYMFGDVGCGHITQCENHKSQLAFGWACG